MHMHKERSELTLAVVNGTLLQSVASLHLFCYPLLVDDWKYAGVEMLSACLC